MNKRVILALISSLFVLTSQAAPVPPATNKDGSPVSGFLEAKFDLRAPVVAPFPINVLFDRHNLGSRSIFQPVQNIPIFVVCNPHIGHLFSVRAHHHGFNYPIKQGFTACLPRFSINDFD